MAYRAYGTESSGTGAVTYPLPSSWVVGDLLLLIVETGSELPSAPAGWSQLVTVENPGQTRLTVFWRIAQSGDTAPTVADPGDHQIGHTASISDVDATRPWDLDGSAQPSIATSIVTTASSSISLPSVTTTTANCQVLLLVSVPADSASWPFTATGSAWVNAALTGFGSGAGYFGHAAVDGNGGAFGGVLGVKATAGVVGATTSTLSGGAQQQALITVALRPPDTSITGTLGVTDTPTMAGAGAAAVDGAGAATADAVLDAAGSVDGLPVDGVGAATVGASLDGAGASSVLGDGAATIGATLAAAGNGGAFGRGAFGSARVLYGTAAGTVSVTLSTAASGSTVFVCVGGRLADLATAMTDSRGNAWTLLYTEEYARWAGYGLRVYRCIGLDGGAGHVFSQQFGQTAGFDEATIAVYEQRGAAYVASTSMVERGIAASLATGSVTSQAACAWLVFFSGDAPTGATSVLTPDNGLAILDQSTGIDHPNGYVPIVILAADKLGGSHTSTIGITPSQGAIIFAAAIQEAEVIGGDLDVTIGAPTLEAAGAIEITASGSATTSTTADGAGGAAVAGDGAAAPGAALDGAGASAVAGAGAGDVGAVLDAAGAVVAPITGDGSAATTSSLDGSGAAAVEGGGSATTDAVAAGSGYAVDPGTIVGELAATTSASLAAAGTVLSRPPRAHYTTTATGARTVPATLIAGDLEPDLLVPLLEPHATIGGALQPIDLTGVQLVELVWLRPGAADAVILPAEIHGATAGQVAHTWAAGETDDLGLHRYLVRITWPGGERQHVPSDGSSYTLLISAASIS